MKELLIDALRQAAPLFDKVRVVGSDTGTMVEAYTDDKSLFLFAELKDVVPELTGEFGLSNLPLLRGLLDFASYKTDNAKFQARRMVRDGADYVAELEFSDADGGHTRYKTVNPRMLGKRAHLDPLHWTVSMTPSKAKLTEVIQLTGMLAQVDQHFAITCDDRTLFLTIGGKGASNHNASVALENNLDLDGPLTKAMFRMPHFISVVKNAGNLPCTIRFAREGVCNILVETSHGTYSYVLRGVEG